MKVLWFTSTSSLYNTAVSNHSYNGCGWIASLEKIISGCDDLDLHISFFHPTDERVVTGVSTYHPIKMYKMYKFKNLIDKHHPLKSKRDYEIHHMISVVHEVKPDVIHIFGTEHIFAELYKYTEIPIVIHIQGILTPYANAYYPVGINKHNVWFTKLCWKSILVLNSYEDRRHIMIKQGLREVRYFENVKYFMGRTSWDKSLCHLYSGMKAKYYHVDEILRSSFYENAGSWTKSNRDKLVIYSTISDTIYKGLDLIIKTVDALEKYCDMDFEWRVAGINDNSYILSFLKKNGFECKSPRISFLGVRNEEQLLNDLLGSDIYVHPSYIDNSPNSLCEAQILGVPCIGTYVGGIPSLIKQGSTGILVPANSPDELAFEIMSMSNDPERMLLISKNGSLEAQRRHSTYEIKNQIINCYKDIINTKQ